VKSSSQTATKSIIISKVARSNKIYDQCDHRPLTHRKTCNNVHRKATGCLWLVVMIVL